MKEEAEAPVGSWRPMKISAFTLGDTRPLKGCEQDILWLSEESGCSIENSLQEARVQAGGLIKVMFQEMMIAMEMERKLP